MAQFTRPGRPQRRGRLLGVLTLVLAGVAWFAITAVTDRLEESKLGFKVDECVQFDGPPFHTTPLDEVPCDAPGLVFQVVKSNMSRGSGNDNHAGCPDGDYAVAERRNAAETSEDGLAVYYGCLIPLLHEESCYDASWDDRPGETQSYEAAPDCQQAASRRALADGTPISGVVRVAARLDSVEGQCPAGSDRRFTFSEPGRAFCVTDVS